MGSTHRLPIVGMLTPQAVTESAEREAARLFAEGGARAVGEETLAWHEHATREIEERIPRTRAVGCAEGCAYCCHLKVIASPVEVIHLARHLRRTRDAEALAVLVQRLRVMDASTRGLGTSERAALRRPCPLLEDNRCSAYEARPLHCAGANAADPAQCKEAFEAVDRDVAVSVYRPQAALADVIAAGISRAAFATHRAGAMLELVSGLLLALEDPAREEAWERGEDSFCEARDLELEALIGQAAQRT